MGTFLKLPPGDGSPRATAQDLGECYFARTFPCLHEWLTLEAWDDGAPRVTSSLTLFLDEGRVKACLSDRHQQRVAFVSGWTVSDALAALEEGLLGLSLDWRPGRKENGRQPRK